MSQRPVTIEPRLCNAGFISNAMQAAWRRWEQADPTANSYKLGTRQTRCLMVEERRGNPMQFQSAMQAGRRPNRPTRYVGLIENNRVKKESW